MGRSASTLASALLGLLGCAPPPAAAQPQGPPRAPTPMAPSHAPPAYAAMAGGDARHTGRSALRGPREEPAILWRVRTRRRVFASPAVDARGRVVFGSLDGEVLAVDRGGVVRWGYGAPDRVFSAPAVAGELTVFGHDGDRFVAVDERGVERWTFATGDDADAPPTVGPDGTIYVASAEVAALSPDGRARWTTPLRAHAFGPVALSPDGNVYATDLAGRVTVLHASDGAVVRRVELPAPIHGGVLVLDDGGFVAAADDGHVRCFAPDGTPRWDRPTRGASSGLGARTTPALTRDGVVVVGAEDGGIYGLRVADGAEAFRVQTSLPVRSSARIDVDGWIYVGSEDDQVRALDPSGAVRWSVSLGADVDGSPAILPDGTLVVGADDGALYALGAR